jgi:uncharacterized protein YbjT (DUF2867 family)
MRVTIFGAAGKTGRLLVEQAVAAGHEVTAFVRTDGQIEADRPSLRVVVGDARDEAAVASAVQDAEGVLSGLGGTGFGPSTAITDATSSVCRALHGRDVRLLTVSTVGAGGSGKQLPMFVRTFVSAALRSAIKDHEGAEAAVRASGTRWTIVRCVGLTDDPPRGSASAAASGPVGGSRIPRADVAAWMVEQLSSPEYVGQAVALW